jgi:hypothetical protein
MAQYLLSHPLPGTQGSSPTITRNEFLASEIVSQLLQGLPTNRPDGTLLGYAELKGSFAFWGPAPGAPLKYPYAFAIFDAQTGNLLMYGGLNGPTPTSTPTPTPTVSSNPTPTATRTPAPAPQLSVSPTGTIYVTCGSLPLSYPTVTVRNSGGGTLTWQASATNAQVTLSPASGSLGAGQSQTMTVSQTSGSAGTDIHVSSNGGGATVSFICIVG